MTAAFFAEIEAIAIAGGSERHRAKVAHMRADFEARTGAFGPEDPWFDARSRAFWDDAMTTQGFAAFAAEAVEPGMAARLGRAHRGLFSVKSAPGGLVLADAWGGARFFVTQWEGGLGDALAREEESGGLVDARLVGMDAGVHVLSGAFFHPEEATTAALDVLGEAARRGLRGDAVLDALLRMELRLRSLTRVRPEHAYRAAALSAGPRTA